MAQRVNILAVLVLVIYFGFKAINNSHMNFLRISKQLIIHSHSIFFGGIVNCYQWLLTLVIIILQDKMQITA